MSYYGFSAARYLPGKQAAYATKGQGIAQLGQAIGQATQTVGEAVAQQKKAEKLLDENKEYFDQSYNATFRLYKDKLIELGVPEEEAMKVIQTTFTPITPMEYKDPKLYLETKAQQAKKLDNYIAKLEGQQQQQQLGRDISQLTQPSVGPEVPQQQTTLGQGQSVTMFGAPSVEPPQAQTPQQLESELYQRGYSPEMVKQPVETMQKQQTQQRIQQQQAVSQQQAQQRIQQEEQRLMLSKDKFKEYQRAQKEKDERVRIDQMMKIYREHPSVEEASKTVDVIDRTIKNTERKIQIYKEQGSHILEAQAKGQLKKYKDALSKAKKTVEQAEYIQQTLMSLGANPRQQTLLSPEDSVPTITIGENEIEYDPTLR